MENKSSLLGMTQEEWSKIEPAPEYGTDLRTDIVELAIDSCMSQCGYDISALEDDEYNQILVAILDAWTDWPADNSEADKAGPRMLRSLAVAGGWEEFLL